MQFRYRAIDHTGSGVSGVVDGRNERDAIRKVTGQNLTLVSIGEEKATTRRRRGRASTRELQLVLQEFTTLLEAGVALATSLSSLAKSSHHPQITTEFSQLERSVRRGDSFSQALRGSSLPLPDYFHQLVEAGEATGRLAEALRSGVDQFEYDQRVRKDMQSALVYPAVLVCSGIAAVAIIFLWVVPKFGGMLTQQGADLPLLSRWVIGGGMWFSDNVMIVVALLVLAILAVRTLIRRPGVRESLIERAASLPLLGEWLVEAEVGRWASTMAALLTGRVELIRALDLSAQSVRLGFLRNRLVQVARSVKAGATLSAALREHNALNATGYDLVAVGETSGQLPKLLGALARLYETTGRDRMKRALQLIEPLAIVLIGGVVGILVTAIILAITSVNDVPL